MRRTSGTRAAALAAALQALCASAAFAGGQVIANVSNVTYTNGQFDPPFVTFDTSYKTGAAFCCKVVAAEFMFSSINADGPYYKADPNFAATNLLAGWEFMPSGKKYCSWQKGTMGTATIASSDLFFDSVGTTPAPLPLDFGCGSVKTVTATLSAQAGGSVHTVNYPGYPPTTVFGATTFPGDGGCMDFDFAPAVVTLTGVCPTCPAGQQIAPGTTRCVSVCTPGSEWHAVQGGGGLCCRDGQFDPANGGQCDPVCPSNEVFSRRQDVCCPVGAALDSQGGCACPSNQVVVNGACACANNELWYGGSCACGTNAAELGITVVNNTCTCPNKGVFQPNPFQGTFPNSVRCLASSGGTTSGGGGGGCSGPLCNCGTNGFPPCPKKFAPQAQ